MEGIDIFSHQRGCIKARDILTQIRFGIAHHFGDSVVHINDITIVISDHGIGCHNIQRLLDTGIGIGDFTFAGSVGHFFCFVDPFNNGAHTLTIRTDPWRSDQREIQTSNIEHGFKWLLQSGDHATLMLWCLVKNIHISTHQIFNAELW